MQVLVKPELKKYITSVVDHVESHFNSHVKYDCIIGDFSMFKSLVEQDSHAVGMTPYKILVVKNDETVSLDLYNEINPTAILNEEQSDEISKKIAEAQMLNRQKDQARLARENVEAKRNELEKLNEFLSYQDKERSNALRIFHLEEQSKKQHEKQLLFFLDFINSNYAKSSFLDELLHHIWKEIKKIGTFYQLGIIIKLEGDDQAILFQYDDRKYYSQRDIQLDSAQISDAGQLAAFLANIYQRPVGKILFWSETHAETQSKVQFYLYLETKGKEYSAQGIESFISDRLSLLSLIISRWITEESEKILLRQWRNTFKAYKDPIHVVDEEFNIIQASYMTPGQPLGKCYEILAHRTTQCLHCPLVKPYHQKSLIDINSQQYKVHSSAFTAPAQDMARKKYFLLFYENITEMNSLKSQLIQSEKMNTIGNLANHLAHELNNPLTGLKLTSEYLMSEIKSQPPEAASANFLNDLGEVFKATTRSEMIIKDLVDFSSEPNQEMQLIDFSVVLKKTMTLLKSVLRNTRVFVDVKSHFIYAQPMYLQQIIFNLIKNACEAMTSQGSIKIYQGPPHPTYADFIIEDTGPGISEDLQADLFKPFFTTKQEGEGTGLGLYLCATLMHKMNGELIYDKKFKAGARFILRFKSKNE